MAQRWAPLIATVVVTIVAVTLALVAARHDGPGNLTVYSIVTGCVALILLYTTVTGRRSSDRAAMPLS